MVVVDTDLIVGLLRGNDGAKKKIIAIENSQKPLIITAFTVFELYKGVNLSQNKDKNLIELQKILSQISVLSFDAKSASIAAELDYNLNKKGIPVGTIDTLIAATCIANNEILITKNIKHFEKIKNLNITSW